MGAADCVGNALRGRTKLNNETTKGSDGMNHDKEGSTSEELVFGPTDGAVKSEAPGIRRPHGQH